MEIGGLRWSERTGVADVCVPHASARGRVRASLGSMTPEPRRGPFVHRGVLYDSVQHCAVAIASRAVAGIDRGERVVVLAEPAVESVVRRQLGPMAGRVAFRPHDWLRDRLPMEILTSAFGGDAGRKAWPRLNVLAQQPRHDEAEDAYWVHAESIANATLAGRAVDLTCFVDSDSGDRNVGNARRTHPTLGSDDGDRPSPEFDPALPQLLRDTRVQDGEYRRGGVLDLDLDDPASARGWLHAAARDSGLAAALTDELLIVVGEAIMTTWEAGPGAQPTADGDAAGAAVAAQHDASDRVRVYLWSRTDGAVCEVVGPVAFDDDGVGQAPTDERLRWLRMASLVCPAVHVSIEPREDAPGSRIRIQVG
jgi:hypothetical protein